jgi:hypothetical protein
MNRPQQKAPLWYSVYVIAAGCAVFLLARQNSLTFPYPWNDEARFYLPALNFAQTGSLSPTILNAPNGIFWMPDGFYVWMGAFLAIFGRSIAIARTLCELTVATSVSIFALSFLKLTRSAGMAAIFTLILISPPIIYAANMVRMEAPLCLLFALALWSHIHRLYWAATALLLLSILFHPGFALALCAYSIALAATHYHSAEDTPPRCKTIAEKTFFLVVVVAFIAEAARIATHFHLFQQHMSYQASRKLSINHWKLLTKPQGVLLCIELATVLVWLRTTRPNLNPPERNRLTPIAAATLGIQCYAVFGGLAAYDVYSLSIAPAIFFCLAYRAIQRSWSPSSGGYRLPLGTGPARS